MDPLLESTPDPAKKLFTEFSLAAHKFPSDAVIGAALNILLNALRQEHDSQWKAAAAWDELSAKTKKVLCEHYDVMGNRRNIFPFTQHLHVPKFINHPKFGMVVDEKSP